MPKMRDSAVSKEHCDNAVVVGEVTSPPAEEVDISVKVITPEEAIKLNREQVETLDRIITTWNDVLRAEYTYDAKVMLPLKNVPSWTRVHLRKVLERAGWRVRLILPSCYGYEDAPFFQVDAASEDVR